MPTPDEILAEMRRWAKAYYEACGLRYEQGTVSAMLIDHMSEFLTSPGTAADANTTKQKT